MHACYTQAHCQFGATAYACFAPPGLCFICVLAIEIASFLMTLVRKNKITSGAYHVAYGAALAIVWPLSVYALLFAPSADGSLERALFTAGGCVACASNLRLRARLSKYLCWCCGLAVGILLAFVVPSAWHGPLAAAGMTAAFLEHVFRISGVATHGLLKGKPGDHPESCTLRPVVANNSQKAASS